MCVWVWVWVGVWGDRWAPLQARFRLGFTCTSACCSASGRCLPPLPSVRELPQCLLPPSAPTCLTRHIPPGLVAPPHFARAALLAGCGAGVSLTSSAATCRSCTRSRSGAQRAGRCGLRSWPAPTSESSGGAARLGPRLQLPPPPPQSQRWMAGRGMAARRRTARRCALLLLGAGTCCVTQSCLHVLCCAALAPGRPARRSALCYPYFALASMTLEPVTCLHPLSPLREPASRQPRKTPHCSPPCTASGRPASGSPRWPAAARCPGLLDVTTSRCRPLCLPCRWER